MIGKTISHYKIIEKLGEGGMGVVYKAEDTKLQRHVALKFLPQEWTRDPDAKARFMNEARAASALQHHNICTIHEIDETEDGQLFICMDFYEGETVLEKIERGPLKLEEALDLANQITEGLTKAHQKDILHRDLKPANVLVTEDGVAKIVDFGLAKLVGRSMLTKEGTILGTAAYMSPEQARGEIVDHRTDIWSLGVLLYEMVSGQRPFKGDYEQAVIYSITNENAPALTGLRSGVPLELERILNKAMAKNPDERYQHADEMHVDLRALQKTELSSTSAVQTDIRLGVKPASTKSKSLITIGVPAVLVLLIVAAVIFFKGGKEEASVGVERKMLVVLPFENLGPPEDDYFAAGLTDAITARLAGIQEIGVIARQSAVQYKNSTKTIQQIGDELGVNYVLEGTAQRERPADPTSRMRVIPQLIQVSDATHLWAETYDQEMNEVFAVQSDIAERVAQAMDITLLASERRIMAAKPTDNLQAYDYYLRGNEYLFDRSLVEKDVQLAGQMYEQALELDPNFAIAYTMLARARIWLSWAFGQSQELPKAKEAIEKARLLAPNLPETHLALGKYYSQGTRDLDKAQHHFSIVQKYEPNNADALGGLGAISAGRGNWEAAVRFYENVLELNSRDHLSHWNLGHLYLILRKYARAERSINRAISLAPDVAPYYIGLSRIYYSWYGSTEKARQVLEEASGRIDPQEFRVELWYLDLTDRNYEQALKGVVLGSDTLAYYLDKSQTYYFMKQTQSAQVYADSARIRLQPLIARDPQNALWHNQLGICYALLDRKKEAISEGRKAVDLGPVSRDARRRYWFIEWLAQIYSIVGEDDAAIDELARLLSRPSLMSVPRLRLEPVWDPLRDHPRFKELLTKYSGAQ